MTKWEANTSISLTSSPTLPACPEATIEDTITRLFLIVILPLRGQVLSGQTVEAQLNVLLLTAKATIDATV